VREDESGDENADMLMMMTATTTALEGFNERK